MAREEIARTLALVALNAVAALGACGGGRAVEVAPLPPDAIDAPARAVPDAIASLPMHAVVIAHEAPPVAPLAHIATRTIPEPASISAPIARSIAPQPPRAADSVDVPLPPPPPPPRLPPTLADLMSPLDDGAADELAATTIARPAVVHHLATDDTHLRRYGMMLDVGVPDGATASLVVRPIRPLRVDAGISYNGVSTGVRGGLTLVPFASWFTPTLSVDAGHYTDGDANPLARMITGNPMFSSPALDQVGYNYADAQAGLELGRKRFTFYLRAGITRVTGDVHNLGAAFSGDMPTMTKGTVTFGTDPALTITALSARLGFVLYFGS